MTFLSPRELLRQAGLAPKRSFGQNFLSDRNVAEAIARTCVPDEEVGRARVVELGAGLGALTGLLLARSEHVIAIERDRDLVPVLEEALRVAIDEGRATVREDDAQKAPLEELLGPKREGSPRVLAGNLPYQITGALLERSVHHARFLERAVFMIQREVADRIVAAPGSKTYGALSVFVQAAFAAKRRHTVSPNSFHPPPQVSSAVVELVPHALPRAAETDTFRAVVKGAFAQRRKTLRNAWAGVPGALDAAAAEGIDLNARGETLGVEAFAAVARAIEAGR